MSANKSRRFVHAFWRNANGSAAVDFGLVGGLFIVMLIGLLEFGTAFWQWNQATKALQLGVRLAAVSDPVSILL